MNDYFQIPVTYKGKELSFSAKLLVFGYTYKVAVDVNGTEIIYELDEERNFRAVIDPEKLESRKIDVELFKAIAEAIEAIVK